MSLATVLEKWGRERPYSYFVPQTLTYSQAAEKSASLASQLSEGSTVVHFMFNSVESILAYLAVFWAGGKVVAVDPLTSAEDLRFILEDSKPDVVFVDEETLKREKDILKDFKVKIPTFSGTNRKPPFYYEDGTPGLSYYYAGIAGRTMEVIHSGYRVWLNSRALYEAIGLQTISTLLTVPVAHVLGNSVLGVTLESGGLLVPMKKFDPAEASDLIVKYEMNFLATVPMVYDSLIEKGHGLSTLEVCISTAAPLFPSTVKGFKEKFGKDIIQQYGFTEGLVLTLQPKETAGIITIGKPLKEVRVKVIKEDGKEAKEGEPGELWVMAPWLMLGYKDKNENQGIWRDGWLRTGDIVSLDSNGLLYFRGIKKRMLKYKGYPIFPRDLELILLQHPEVKDAKVLGEDMGNIGQQPVAHVVLRDGAKTNEEELINYVNSKVAFYKRLKKVIIVNRLE
ncbi:acyl--CoA ligase [Metallosphaera tengchongensis]|uniref:Acyl--CoA ligase n=1 Tax=Metallosphaera tengchongensis TaxID=1532350 RepID=A0A6N0NU39_9CREN|nr:class I adenylate-forming enzyme family protein [Metallosphaera tengchongensis]QKQ99288.1 acyl--CoA ligase [Metallosphaera tengchongensis]